MVWDPFGTIGNAFWIGGGQCAGKSTVARILAHRHGLTAYHFDYQNVHAHYDRRLARLVRSGEPTQDPDPEDLWIRHTPAEMAAQVLADFHTDFEWVLDDLRALVSGNPIIAEGWGLRPELVAGMGFAQRMLIMVPTEEFRSYQLRTLDRARAIHAQVSDPEKAQRNRIERDALITADAVASARRLDIPIIEVDGSQPAESVADMVAVRFGLT
jgi:2-phosphoglycerate kinase